MVAVDFAKFIDIIEDGVKFVGVVGSVQDCSVLFVNVERI